MNDSFNKLCRFYILVAGILLSFGAIGYRLVDISLLNRSEYLKEIEQTHKSHRFLNSKRGNIVDRNGKVIATSKKYIEIGIDAFAAKPKRDTARIEKLAEILEIDFNDLIKFFYRKKVISGEKIKKIRWLKIAEIDKEETFEEIKALKISGVRGVHRERREYVNGHVFCHITGFLNKDGEAQCGVEKYMNFYLKGQSGFIETEKDGKQNELVQYRSSYVEPKNGCDVVLTIDSRVQNIVYDEVQKLVEKYSPEWVCAIVSDATTGEMLGFVNYPDYDTNCYWKFDLVNMRNRAISDVYEPGSVFKIVASSLALEAGLVNERTVFDCTQKFINYDGRNVSLPNDHHDFGRMSLVDVMRKSSNRGAAMLAMMLGDKNFYNGVKSFGFGELAGYGFDSEVKGILNHPSKWDGLTISRMPMGHAIAVTPLQMHYAMSVLASDGVLFSPQLFKKISDGTTVVASFNPRVRHDVISRQTAIRMREMLFNPNNKQLKNGINFCGKTGTAQKIINGQYSHSQHVSGFSGFFPVEKPKIVITIVVDGAHVSSGIAWGSRVSEPAFVDLAARLIDCFGM